MELPAGQLEWLETGRFGSFALGCVDRRLRRKYHALLTAREPGRGDPWNVLAELREHLSCDGERALLCDPLTGASEGAELTRFTALPFASHRYRVLGLTVARSIRFDGDDRLEVRYQIAGVKTPLRFELEPLLRCRALHALTFENPFLDGSVTQLGDELCMTPYAGMPELRFRIERDGVPVSVALALEGHWLKDVAYAWEAARGYESREHLFSPGRFALELERDAELSLRLALDRHLQPEPVRPSDGQRVVRGPQSAPQTAAESTQLASEAVPAVDRHEDPAGLAEPSGRQRALAADATHGKRGGFAQRLERAADQFFMQTRAGETRIVAGYPWFGAWSRDALIALPGLYLATGDFERAAAVLESALKSRVNGLVPNIPAHGDTPANTCSVDASLLFVRAVQWFGAQLGAARVERFMPAVCELLEALADARDARMRFDQGVGVWSEPGPWALTWMDALVDGRPVTPRAGYAVEVDALAYNAARFACAWAGAHRGRFARAFRLRLRAAEADFVRRYWDDSRGYLADAHDGRRLDAALRPNQLFALGLPESPLPKPLARAALAAVTRELLVPAGLRTLSPRDPAYRGSYGGEVAARDRAYHQGSAWPWLIGIYADALRAIHGRAALATQLAPTFAFFARHLEHEGCTGQISELFAGDAPHAAGGAPAQAWSVAELYRAFHMLHDQPTPRRSLASTAVLPTV